MPDPVTGFTIGGSILGGSIAASGARSASSTQADAANRAADLQRQTYEEQTKLNAPYREAGITGQNRLMELLGLGGNTGAAGYGQYANAPTAADIQTDPGYAFRLSEGQKALDRSAAARGGLISGGALKAATRYGQDMGSQEYQNAFNRYQTNRSNQLSPLFSLTGSGQASAAGQAAAAGNYGTQGAAGITSAGAANAAGTVGAANALTAGLGSYLNYSSNQDLVDVLKRKTAYA
jgi:hypothetical protein